MNNNDNDCDCDKTMFRLTKTQLGVILCIDCFSLESTAEHRPLLIGWKRGEYWNIFETAMNRTMITIYSYKHKIKNVGQIK